MDLVILENEEKFGGDYPNLLRDIFNCIEDSAIGDTKKKESLLLIPRKF